MDFDDNTEKRLMEMAKGKRVLITGGAGYLGSVLCEMLIGRGFHITVIDNLSYAQNTLYNLFHTGRVKFIYGDVTNEKFMQKTLSEEEYEFIMPLAAVVGFPISEQKPEITWMINHGAIKTILKFRRKGSKIIFPTTNSGYGATDGKSACTEESPLSPVSTYGKSKAAAEQDIMKAGDCVCFRLATLFGFSPRMRTDLLVNDFVYKAYKDKALILFERKFKRNFLHVMDAARAFLWAMANWDRMKDNVYNVGHPDYNITKEELALMIKKSLPELNIFSGDIGSDPDKRNYIISNDRMLATGFEFRHPLEEGIRELIGGYEAFRDYRFRNY
jgi:nucleoside-diphosphate-sugar epimerase